MTEVIQYSRDEVVGLVARLADQVDDMIQDVYGLPTVRNDSEDWCKLPGHGMFVHGSTGDDALTIMGSALGQATQAIQLQVVPVAASLDIVKQDEVTVTQQSAAAFLNHLRWTYGRLSELFYRVTQPIYALQAGIPRDVADPPQLPELPEADLYAVGWLQFAYFHACRALDELVCTAANQSRVSGSLPAGALEASQLLEQVMTSPGHGGGLAQLASKLSAAQKAGYSALRVTARVHSPTVTDITLQMLTAAELVEGADATTAGDAGA